MKARWIFPRRGFAELCAVDESQRVFATVEVEDRDGSWRWQSSVLDPAQGLYPGHGIESNKQTAMKRAQAGFELLS